MEQEIWKDVGEIQDLKEFAGLYTVSNFGNVKSFHKNKNGKLIKLAIHPKGYAYARFNKNKKKNFFVHRLVCELFNDVSPLGKDFVNHVDGDKTNNHYTNLEWVSHSENIRHAVNTGLCVRKGKKHRKVVQKNLNGEIIAIHKNLKTAANHIGVNSTTNIRNACIKILKTSYGFIWEFVEQDEKEVT